MFRSVSFAQVVIPVLTILCIGGILIFGQSGIYGEYGLIALREAGRQERVMLTKKAALETERARLENLTSRLGTEEIDLDLLDEQARRVLGFIRNDEIIVE